MIKVDNLSFNYGDKNVLSNISFEAEKGDVLCVLGPNGVGKSTLFRCMLKLLRGYSGEIFIDNTNIKNISNKQMSKKTAYIPQSHYPTFNYKVIDMVLMGMTSSFGLSSPGDKDEQRAFKVLESLGIDYLASSGYGEISGGERQLVLIARAIAQNAKILIMDEPTANLDYGNQIRVMKQVRSLAKEGYTIIVSTHNPDHAFLYGNKALVILNGLVEKFGMPCDILDEELIKKVYGVRVNLLDVSLKTNNARVCVPILN